MSTNNKQDLEDLMKSQVSPPLARKLVWAGIIPSNKFVRALNLSEGNSFLKRYGFLFLALAGFVYIAAGLCSFLSAVWYDIPYIFKVSTAASVLIISLYLASKKKEPSIFKTSFLSLAILFTGVLLLLAEDGYELGKTLWQTIFLWALLVLPWTILAKSLFLWSVWFSIAFAAAFMWGLEVGMPTGAVSWPDFFSIMAVACGLTLGVREGLVAIKKIAWLDKPLSRLIPLFVSMSLAVFPIIGYITGIKGASPTDSSIIFLLITILALVFYFRIFPDLYALTVIIFEICFVLAAVCVNKYLGSHDDWYMVFIAIILIFGFSSWMIRKLKETFKKAGAA